MLFGIYLVESGAITHEDFFVVIRQQLKSRPQLGALAVERQMLTMRQVFDILWHQCDSPTKMFGELAIEFGYLTADQLQTLLHEQSRRVTPLSDILVECGVMSEEAAALHHGEFHGAKDYVDDSLLVRLA